MPIRKTAAVVLLLSDTSRYETTGNVKNTRMIICAGVIMIWLTGCAHNSLNYPNSPISGINPSDYVNNPCPDFSGTYQGFGYLIDGDISSRRTPGVQRLSFDMIFPIGSDPEGWENIQHNYRAGTYADYAKIKQIGPRSVEITMSYKNHVIGSYRSDYKDHSIFVCKDGKLMAGGPDRITANSEMGKNYSERSFVLYKDDRGNIVCEKHMYVHMTLLDIIPTGTSKHYTKYLFKKLK